MTTPDSVRDWLRHNLKPIQRQPNLTREDYFQSLTRIYYQATQDHWASELAAECHVDYALDGHVDLSATELRILKRGYQAVCQWRKQSKPTTPAA